jgi:alpha-N-acetylglucosaminidase
MKTSGRVIILALIFFSFGVLLFGKNNPSNSAQGNVKAVYGLLERILPGRSENFIITLTAEQGKPDEFEIEASDGKVKISGSSTNALTKGIYYYIRRALNGMVCWNGVNLNAPEVLPPFPLTKISTPYELRLYYNVCTYGYTTAFWGWERWEKEIDWMALHGINMPVAMIGQESVWKRVWKNLGITDNELSEYFTGPAFLPWHRMGNVNSHGGPLPESYLTASEELQKKILNRMRELGMEPVVPAFSGYVPGAIKRVFPEAEVITMKPWAGFPPEAGTYMLSPLSNRFTEIGKMFIEEYRKTYGKNHFYLADAFNEMVVPVSNENRYGELENFGKALFNSINSGDPEGVWVMQGWLFYADRKFWDKPSAQALLKSVPDKRMIIIDLAQEMLEGWKKHDGFYGKKWIYSFIPNYGGHNQLFGDLPYYSASPAKMLADSSRGCLAGFGVSPEGTENNEVLYELLSDVQWTDRPIDLDKWIEGYCFSRYGSYPKEMKEAWRLLIKSVYSWNSGSPEYLFQRRPGTKMKSDFKQNDDFDKAAELFLSCSDSIKNNKLYDADLIEIAVQYASTRADSLIKKACGLNKNNEPAKRDEAFAAAFSLLEKIDGALNLHPVYRLKRWVDFAREWGTTPKEADYYEANAKRQITTWGGPELSEYACKTWSGLIKNYYLPRWQKYADSLKTGSKCDLFNWEEKWIVTPVKNSAEKPGNPAVLAKELITEAKKAFDSVTK